jgi:hypothetical protein
VTESLAELWGAALVDQPDDSAGNVVAEKKAEAILAGVEANCIRGDFADSAPGVIINQQSPICNSICLIP